MSEDNEAYCDETEGVEFGDGVDAEIAQLRDRLREVEREVENYKAYGDEAWAWLEEALDLLGAETVFDLPSVRSCSPQEEADLDEALDDNEAGFFSPQGER